MYTLRYHEHFWAAYEEYCNLRNFSQDFVFANNVKTWAGQDGGGNRGSGPPPQKNHENIVFISNTGPGPLKNHKVTKAALKVGPSSALQQNAIYMAVCGWIDDGRL